MQNNSAESPRQDDFNLRKNSKLNSGKKHQKRQRKPVDFLVFFCSRLGGQGASANSPLQAPLLTRSGYKVGCLPNPRDGVMIVALTGRFIRNYDCITCPKGQNFRGWVL